MSEETTTTTTTTAEKQQREVARCVRTLLKTRGQTITLKELVPMLEGKDLTDPVALTQEVSQELASRPQPAAITTTTTEKVSRSQAIGDWFVQNYEIIHACPEVEEGLLHLVSRGRVSKDEQERRRAALIARATGGTDTEETEETPEVETTEATTVSSEYNF